MRPLARLAGPLRRDEPETDKDEQETASDAEAGQFPADDQPDQEVGVDLRYPPSAARATG
jgi:hypothetical protein